MRGSGGKAVITWDIPTNPRRGTYRIRHFGHRLSSAYKIIPFNGTSSTFKVSYITCHTYCLKEKEMQSPNTVGLTIYVGLTI